MRNRHEFIVFGAGLPGQEWIREVGVSERLSPFVTKLNTLKNQIVIVLYSSILLACATADQVHEEEQFERRSRTSNCISEGTIRDYRVLDEANLIVTAGGKRRYHVVLSRRAFGLKSSWGIGFSSSTGQICSRFSDIVLDQGSGAEKIRIRSIFLLNPDEEELLLIKFGLKEAKFEQTPAPTEVQGAEVEELD